MTNPENTPRADVVDEYDACDCCKGRPGAFLRAGAWLCAPCESYDGIRRAGGKR